MKNELKIGFTYDLKSDYLNAGYSEEESAEFDTSETIDGICDTLKGLGYQVDRIGNVHALLARLHAGDRWDLVFNICEGLTGSCREAQVPVVLDIYNIPHVFSDGLVLSLTLDKGMTKRVIRDLGMPTAAFDIVRTPSDIQHVNLPFPLFVKPVAEGTGKGIGPHSKVENMDKLYEVCLHQLHTYNQPVLVEVFLPGREITVGMIGHGEKTRVLGMMEVVFLPHEQTQVYSYENKAHYEKYVQYVAVEKVLYDSCAEMAIKAWRGLGCLDAGRIDIRLDNHGVPNFLEVNPLAGLNPVHSDLPILARMAGVEFSELIGMIMDNAIERLKI